MSTTDKSVLKGDHVVMNPTGLAGRYVDKVVLVTGGTKGIGEGCVRVFFEAGANVAFCARNQQEGDDLVADLNSSAEKRGLPQRAIFFRTDVSDMDAVAGLVEKTVEHFKQLDCLVNNAGWHPPHGPIDGFSLEDMQSLMNLNFFSAFVACKAAIPHLRATQGNIINMSSFVGVAGQAGAVTYAATKGAITSFSKGLAVDEAKHNVRVNVVSPGNIWTPLWRDISATDEDPDKCRGDGDLVQHMGRKGTIEETGRLCLSIAADMTFTTGVDHLQTGGAELGYGSKF
eukprot:Rhum_TRINITY_DN20713_c0_g1::Rhum_TRINITY_DN20713_c0_g1_i1::g.171963::m.171963